MKTGYLATHSLNPASLLGIIALLFLVFYFRALPHTLDPLRENNTASQFDTLRALERLSRVLDGTPHPVDSAAQDETRARLLREIRDAGYSPQTREHTSCFLTDANAMRCARVQNVFFRTGPTQGPALVLTAHYDSWEAGPGFADDGLGIAVWLEVAFLLQQQDQGQTPTRPVVFLFTDGEELDLLGARAFVANQADYGFEVGRVINLEARGTRGPAMMFETSHPNGAIVRDWARNGARHFSNSMMTAVYELLPNSTDLTEYLEAGSAGINIAIADGHDFYHTSRDDGSVLDLASAQHMGDQALGTVRAFLSADWSNDVAGGEIAYSDILSRAFVALPQTLTLMLLVVCFSATLVLLIRPARAQPWQKPDWRALILPPLFFAVAAFLAFLLPLLVRLFRAEPVFWMAHPQALAMTVFASTLAAAMLVLATVTPRSRPDALFAAAWFWLLGSGLVLSIAVPGFAMVYLIPGVLLLVTGGAAWFLPRLQTAALATASALLILHFFPLIQLIEVALGLATPAMFAVMEAMVLAPVLALLQPAVAHRNKVLLASAGVALASLLATILAPAYDDDHPLPLNFIAHYDADAGTAVLVSTARQGSLPPELREQFVTAELTLPPGVANDLPAHALEYAERSIATATLLSAVPMQDERTITLQFSAPEARAVRLTIPADARPLRARHGGETVEAQQTGDEDFTVEIFGRSADGAVVEITLGTPQQTDIVVQGIWSGLPSTAQALADQRPATSTRIQIGDVTVTRKNQSL